MTRLAILADIHGNLPALEAVTEDLAQQQVDHVVVAGDLVGWGPDAAAVLERVTRAGWAVIRGNHELYVLDYNTARAPEEWKRHTITPWVCRQIPARWHTRLAAWPDSLSLRFADAPLLRVAHGSPRSPWEGISWYTPEAEVEAMLAGTPEPTLVVGHTHIPLERSIAGRQILNPGSVGMPLDGTRSASYLLLDGDANGWRPLWRRVPFDYEALFRAFEGQGLLEACGLSGHLILHEFRTARTQLNPFHRWHSACCPAEPLDTALLERYAQINTWNYRLLGSHVNVAAPHTRLQGSMGAVDLVRAEPHQLDDVLALLEEAAAWLTARGIDQWQPGSFSQPQLAAGISRGEVYLARRGDEAVGTITLQWWDALVWGELPAAAGYVHNLATRRAAAPGLGALLLGWAEQQAAAAGKHYLRLDCMADNMHLRRYYERTGFIDRGRLSMHGWNRQRYEKRLGV
jgi:predicted phosphodiesterase